jgi:uncharacterized protein (TIGR02996 family)
MTDADALFAAILADPADDAPRLVYADWLEEHGQPERAEFIRVQCELARDIDRCHCECINCNDPAGRQTVCAFRRRERELWNASRLNGAPHPWFPKSVAPKVRSNWLSSVDEPVMTVYPEGQKIEMRLARGFVAEVRLACEAFAGGPCGRCYRGIRTWEDRPPTDCPTCSGTGRTPGIAGPLFAAQPVEVVRLDRSPTRASDRFGDGWTWSRRRYDPADVYTIPDELHSLLPEKDCQQTALDAGYRRWDIADAAHAALRAACVSLGLQRAGVTRTERERAASV